MIIHSYPWGLRGHSPAKLNLTLEVLSKRSDGYHEIESLMVPVNLYDTLSFSANHSGHIDFTCSWCQSSSLLGSGGSVHGETLPRDARNLVVRAVQAVRAKAHSQAGAVVHLIKRIPTQSGLGGGSSDAACALVMANRGWNTGLAADELAAMAAEIGSDVPFFLANQAAICRGRGEKVTLVSTSVALPVVVVKPPVGLSTPEIYHAVKISERSTRDERATSRLASCLARGDRQQLGKLIQNNLAKPAATISPWLERMRRDLRAAGCVAQQMTGSGSAYFGVCHHHRHAQAVAGRMRSKGYAHVFQLQSCRH